MSDGLEKERWNIAQYAYENVPLYREKLQDTGLTWDKFIESRDWGSLPIIEKNEIVRDAERMISEEYIAEVALERLIHTHTSGSTGTFLDVYWRNEDMLHALIPLWVERWKTAKIRTDSRVCQFNTTLVGDKYYDIVGNRLILSKDRLSAESFEETYERICDFEPMWMILHPAIAMMLLEEMRKRNLPAFQSLRYVELTGEMAFEGLKRELETRWGCTVKMHYGTMEVQSIGYEEDGRYRLYEQSTYVEVLDERGQELPEGKSGNIYVTSLHNRVMPFIRYGIGDVGFIQSEQQGNKLVRFLVLEKARQNDRIVLENGKKVPADVLLKPIETVNGYYQNVIYQFQAVQKSTSEIEVQIVMDEEFGRDKFIRIYKDVIRTTAVRDMDISFSFSSCIYPQKETGKICWFTNEIRERQDKKKKSTAAADY